MHGENNFLSSDIAIFFSSSKMHFRVPPESYFHGEKSKRELDFLRVITKSRAHDRDEAYFSEGKFKSSLT